MADPELEAQVAAEKEELANLKYTPLSELMPKAPEMVAGGLAGRCSLCGRFRTDLEPYDIFHGVERFRGGCCGGHTHRVSEQIRQVGGSQP